MKYKVWSAIYLFMFMPCDTQSKKLFSSKIVDHCIISCKDATLKSDSLQFVNKSGMSTIQCVSVVNFNYYLHNKSYIYNVFPYVFKMFYVFIL